MVDLLTNSSHQATSENGTVIDEQHVEICVAALRTRRNVRRKAWVQISGVMSGALLGVAFPLMYESLKPQSPPSQESPGIIRSGIVEAKPTSIAPSNSTATASTLPTNPNTNDPKDPKRDAHLEVEKGVSIVRLGVIAFCLIAGVILLVFYATAPGG